MTETAVETVRPDFSIPLSIEHSLRTEVRSDRNLGPADYLAQPTLKPTESTKKTSQDNLVLAAAVQTEPAQAQLPLKKQSVDGAVLTFDPVSVTCEVYLDRGPLRVEIPRTFFPSGIRYGSPIAIALDEAGGVRRPVISLRQPDAEKLKAENEEMAALVAALKQ